MFQFRGERCRFGDIVIVVSIVVQFVIAFDAIFRREDKTSRKTQLNYIFSFLSSRSLYICEQINHCALKLTD